MAGISKNLLKSTASYTRTYRNMGGVDFNGDGSNISKKRFADLKNMYVNYRTEGMGVIESIPGFREVDFFGKRINGIFLQKTLHGDFLIIHAGDGLYRKSMDKLDTRGAYTYLGALEDTKSVALANSEALYLMDGKSYIKITPDGTLVKIGQDDGKAYLPTVYYNGREYEPRNMLSDTAIESFSLYDTNDLCLESKELLYQISDKSNYKCAIVGVKSTFEGALYIPSKHKMGDVTYEVESIVAQAFAEIDHISQSA